MLLNEMFDDYGELILSPTDFVSLEVYHELIDLITAKDAEGATTLLQDMRAVNIFSTRTVGMLFEDAAKKFDVTINQVDGLIIMTLGTLVAPFVSERAMQNAGLEWAVADGEARITVTLDDLVAQQMSVYTVFAELADPVTRPKKLLPKFFKAVVDEVPISYQAALVDLQEMKFELIGQLPEERQTTVTSQPDEIDYREDARPFKFVDYDHMIDYSFLLNDAGQRGALYRLDSGEFVAMVPTQDETVRALAVEYKGQMMPVAAAYVEEHGRRIN